MKNNQSKKEINKKNININIIIVTIIFVLAIIGISYAFFSYNRTGDENSKLIAGQIYLKLNEGTDSISLPTIFPMSAEEARKKSDNVLKFSISGVNTTKNKDIYYEIKLNEGIDINGMSRFNPEDLRFDLTEIIDGQRNLVIDNMTYQDFNDRRIWVNTVNHDTNDEINIEYELRMWLSDDVLISDTLPDASYTTGEYRNSYANVKIAVFGDFTEKSVPYNYMKKDFGTEISNLKANVKEVQFVSLDKNLINEKVSNATIKYDATDTNKSKVGSVMVWLENDELITNADSTTTQYYKMYVASDGITFFPSNCKSLFAGFQQVVSFVFENVDTRYVTDMTLLFDNCRSITNLEISNWDVSNVTNMSSMFNNCKSITSLNISNWDVSNVTNLNSFFRGCTNLQNVDIKNWNVDKLTNVSAMFADCSKITNIDLSGWNASNITTMSQMFYRCYELVSINLTGWNVESLTSTYWTFRDCRELVTIYADTNWQQIATNLSDSANMFRGCTKLVGKVPFNSSNVEISMANPDTGYFTRKDT